MSNKAVITYQGKQHLVYTGQIIKVGKLPAGKTHVFKDLLSGRKVTATLTGEGKTDKIPVIKFKSKSRYLRRKGYREPVNFLTIEKIN